MSESPGKISAGFRRSEDECRIDLSVSSFDPAQFARLSPSPTGDASIDHSIRTFDDAQRSELDPDSPPTTIAKVALTEEGEAALADEIPPRMINLFALQMVHPREEAALQAGDASEEVVPENDLDFTPPGMTLRRKCKTSHHGRLIFKQWCGFSFREPHAQLFEIAHRDPRDSIITIDETTWKFFNSCLLTVADRGVEDIKCVFFGDPRMFLPTTAVIDAAGGKLPPLIDNKHRYDKEH
jgi:hypothetical protein